MEVRQHLPLAELERLECKESNARRAKRLRIIILAMRGYTAPAVAMSLGLSRRTCQDWVYRFNARGLDGLEDHRGKAPRGPLTSEQKLQMQQRMLDNQKKVLNRIKLPCLLLRILLISNG